MKKRYSMLVLWLWPVISMAQAFTPVWESPYNPMTFYVMTATVNDEGLQAGDEIGIFDIDPVTGSEICVGAGILEEVLGGEVYLEMIASMDDGSNPDEANGFTPGNDFIFRLYSQTWGMVDEVEYFFPYPGYDEVFTAQGNTIVNLQGAPEPPNPFQPVWESPYNPMTFYITGAQLDGVDLAAGDQIGIFDIDPNSGEEICVGAAYLTSPLSPEDYLEMIASMDDGSLPDQANGFMPGNAFIFKYISQDILLVEQVVYAFPYAGYDEAFTAQGNTIVHLNGYTGQGEQQILELNAGWTGISSYLVPDNPGMEELLAQISGNGLIIQNLDEYFMPEYGSGTLVQWDAMSGYFIRTEVADQMQIVGFEPQNTTVSIGAGWNLIPVLSDTPVEIDMLFDGNLDKIVMIKEAIGLDIFWPDKSIETLQVLQPGRSYLIRASDSFSITF